MTKTELKLAAYLLDRASDEFSNHGCNDFMERDYEDANLSDDEVGEITDLINERHSKSDPEDNIRKYHVPDWLLMSYLSARLEEESKYE